MITYLIRRFNLLVLTGFTLILLAFLIQTSLNGHPPDHYVYAYFKYVINIATGNWGLSIIDQQPILAKALTAFASTLELCIVAVIATVIIAVPFGLYSGLYQNSNMDYVIMILALTTLSLPVFWIALMMISLPNSMGFSFPIDGLISPIYDIPLVTGFTLIDSLLASDIYQYHAFLNRLEHLILPATVLAFFFITELIRATRHSVSMVMKSNYIKAAYSKGLGTSSIVFQHVIRNAYPSVLNQFKLQLSTIFSFTMTIEIIFSSHGMGDWLLLSIKAGDYIVLPTALLIVSGFILFTSTFLDIMLVFLSPLKRMSLYVD